MWTILGILALALLVGGFFAAGFLAWENDHERRETGHGSHHPH